MKKLRALLVDDEGNALEGLRSLLETYCPDVEIAGTSNSVNDATGKFIHLSPDIVFLDVHMPGGTGFELLEVMRSSRCSVIFVTGHADYAVQAFRVDAVDYLLKPVSYKDLRVAVARAIQRRDAEENSVLQGYTVKISGTTGISFMQSEEIIGIEADGRYSIIHTANGDKKLVTRNVGDFEEELTAHGFFRVHKSWLVNCAHVKRLLNIDGGTVELGNGQRVMVSRRKRAEFLKRMKI